MKGSPRRPGRQAARLVLQLALLGAPGVRAQNSLASSSETTAVYFGSGCFWGRQKDFVDVEFTLGRSDHEVTALVGYAGGAVPKGYLERRFPSGPEGEHCDTARTEHSITAWTTDEAGAVGNTTVQHAAQPRVCYYGASPDTVYDNLGHAEVTQVTLRGPEQQRKEQFVAFVTKFFQQFQATPEGMGRTDPQDSGAGYRTLVGLPHGINGDLFPILSELNVNHMELLEGDGSEEDVVNTVWVMDSKRHEFHAAEAYHQFHQGLGHRYPYVYTKRLRDEQIKLGRVKPTGCPERHDGLL